MTKNSRQNKIIDIITKHEIDTQEELAKMSHGYIICHWGDKMRKVELRMNEKEKYEIIKELVDHNGNKNRASKKLDISRRQIDRLIIKYKEKGKAGFVHGNRTRKPINAFDNSISENIILLYKNKYYDFNFNHFKKFLDKDENIKVSYDFIYKILAKKVSYLQKLGRKQKEILPNKNCLRKRKLI